MKRLIPLFFLLACATPPRTTAEAERAVAHETLTTIETGVLTAYAFGKFDDAQRQLAEQQIAEVRALIDESAETPLSWAQLLQRIANLAIRWAVPPMNEDPAK